MVAMVECRVVWQNQDVWAMVAMVDWQNQNVRAIVAKVV
jgi:hypothetical protein